MNRGPSDPYRFEIDELHPEIAKHVERTDIFHFQGVDYEYGVLNPAVAPVYNAVGMSNGQNLIGASTIADDLKPFYFGHEILCNRLQAGQEGRCARIETGLVEVATPEILIQLLQARRRTFEDLVSRYTIDLQHPANPFHAEIAGTTLYLREKMEELRIEPMRLGD